MTAPDYFTLEGDPGNAVPPTIVALDDGTGGAGDGALCAFLSNDQEFMPNPGQEPDARDLNQTAYLAWAAGVMIPKISIAIHISGTTPSVQSLIAPNRTIVSANITPTRTALGVYTIAVPQTKLPQKTMPPKAYANKGGRAAASAVWTSSALYTVYLTDDAGAIDCDFTLDVFGY